MRIYLWYGISKKKSQPLSEGRPKGLSAGRPVGLKIVLKLSKRDRLSSSFEGKVLSPKVLFL